MKLQKMAMVLYTTMAYANDMTCGDLKTLYTQASLAKGGNGCCKNTDAHLNIPDCNVIEDVGHLVKHTVAPTYYKNVVVDDPTHGKYVPLETFAHHASPTVLQNLLRSASSMSYPALILNKVRLCLYTSLGVVADLSTGTSIGWRENDVKLNERFEDRKYMSKYIQTGGSCDHTNGVCTGGSVSVFSVGYVDVKETDRLSNATLTHSMYMKGKILKSDGTWVDDEKYSTWIGEWRLAACSNSQYSEAYEEWSFYCGYESIEVIVFDKNNNPVPSFSYQQASMTRMRLNPTDLDFYRPILNFIPENIRTAIGINTVTGVIDSDLLLANAPSYPKGDGVYFNQLPEIVKEALTTLAVPEAQQDLIITIVRGLSQAGPMVDCVFKPYLALDTLSYKLFTDAYPR